MRELFFSLGVLALLRYLGFSGWWDIPIVLIILIVDYQQKIKDLKAQSELEMLKLFMKDKK